MGVPQTYTREQDKTVDTTYYLVWRRSKKF